MKRSGREARWAELPPAGTRIALEATFLILVAAGAVVRLTPLSIIALMLVAWLLVAVLKRATSRRQTRALAGVEQAQVPPLPPAEPWAAEPDEPAAEPRRQAAVRRLSSRRSREAVEPLAVSDGLDERSSSAHVGRIEAESRPPVVEAEIVVTEIVVEETPPPGPAVTKLPLDLPGLDAAPPPVECPTEPPPTELPQEPQPVERAAPPISAPVLARPPAREWNIWDLERRAREQAGDALRDEEWAGLFMHLRQFANADGVPPMQFDDLVRESFPELIQAA